MTDIPLPSPGDTSWSDWGQEQEDASDVILSGRLSDTALRAAFGAWADAPTGVDDNVAVLAAAQNGLRLRPGVYVVTTALDIPGDSVLMGCGPDTIIRKKAGATGHTLRVWFTANVTLADFVIDANRTNAPGSDQGLHINGSTNVAVSGVSVRAAVGSCVQVLNSSRVRISGGELTDGYYGLAINGTSSDYRINGVHVQATRAATSYEGGVYITDGARGSLTDVHVRSAAGHGFSIGGTASEVTLTSCVATGCGTAGNDHRGFSFGDTPQNISLVGCIAQGNVECGYYAVASASRLSFTGCTARGNNTNLRPGGHGFEILAPRSHMTGCTSTGQLGDADGEGGGFFLASEVTAHGCHAEGNWGSGFTVYNAMHVVVQGCTARNNSQRGVGLHDGLRAFGDYSGAVTELLISGFHSYDDQATKTQRYGISIEANVNRFVVTSCIVRAADHATGGLNDQQPAATKVVTNNIT